MRVLLVADIHANWPALAAIEESFDACLCLGDIVDYGGDPIRCIEWVRQNAIAAIRGNHDHAVGQRVMSHGERGLRRLAAATRELHWETLQPTHLKYLSMLPITIQMELGGYSYYLVHGTPRDPLDEYLGNEAHEWERRTTDIRANFICVGHTHLPFHLDLGRTQIVNPGSVGQPRDGNPEAAYAIIDDGRVELKRTPYDISMAVESLHRGGLEAGLLAFAETMLRSGGRLPPGE